jgi:FkbM family methyltransferase
MSILEGIKLNYNLFGPSGVLLTASSRLFKKPIGIAVVVEGFSYPIYLRLRTTDISVFEEIILNAEYSFEPLHSPRLIIDAGANIGLTSIFYANKFPHAKIIAIEPEQSNFQMLKKNTALYSNIFPIQGALWKEEATLNLSNPGTGNWGYQTQEQQEGEIVEGNVFGMSVDKLMEQYGYDYIDILKIDIEGSEKEVFETSISWIDKVGAIIVELHDHFKSGCSESVHSATKDFELEWRKGETTFFVKNENPPPSEPQKISATTGSSSTVKGHNFRTKIVSVMS